MLSTFQAAARSAIVAIFFGVLSHVALAQTIPDRLPIQSVVDERGVDLANQMLVVRQTVVSIGSGEGTLADVYAPSSATGQFRGRLDFTTHVVAGTTKLVYQVTIDDQTDTFDTATYTLFNP